jgi:TatD DNase family protein
MEHLFDTHFHLDLQKDRAATIRDVEEKQIYTIAVTNLPELYRKESVEIASKYIRFALGFHPELVYQYKKQVPLMWELLPEVRYVGEVGLDLVDKSSEKEQEAFFSELVERCRYDSNKIFTIHSRRAGDKVLDILGDNYRFKAILHWFSGSKTELERAIDRGCFFSVNGPMMKSKRFLDMLSLIPSSRLLIETDSPFTHYMGSYDKHLKSIKEELQSYKPEADVWTNFRRLLGG